MINHKEGVSAKFQFSITGLILSLLIISMFAIVISTGIADLTKKYPEANFSTANTSIALYDKSNEIKNLSEELRDKVDTITTDPSIQDIVGGFFGSGYSAFKLTWGSLDFAKVIIENSFNDINSPESNTFMGILITWIIIGFFVGIIIAAVMKWVL